jgi:hypothetical protein
MTTIHRRLGYLGLCLVALSFAPAPAEVATAGRSYQVPYQLTETNHFLVRVRINGKGPFNFLVDTGAPALYIATATAKQAGLTPAQDEFWTPLERLDIEGGATLRQIRARVEDPFQLVGMNALGLPGASIDGILGFTILARFRIELDPTKDRMTWTRLDFEPPDPPAPRRGQMPADMQAMNALGPVAKILAAVIGKQPQEQLHPRGFLGLELAEKDENGAGVRVTAVLAGSPAEQGGVRAGDRLVRLEGRRVRDLDTALNAAAEIQSGQRVSLTVRRGEDDHELTLTAGEGL